LGKDGILPLRDVRDPSRTGSPDHMDKYVDTPADNGGVHTNSNIHNKAAFNVLTAFDAQNQPMFTPLDSAILFYICLTRLGKMAGFSETLATLLNVAGTYYAGDQKRQDKLGAIRNAYAKVGIRDV
jgi:bacillolysin